MRSVLAGGSRHHPQVYESFDHLCRWARQYRLLLFGRMMSRRRARESLDVEGMKEQMRGRVWLSDKANA